MTIITFKPELTLKLIFLIAVLSLYWLIENILPSLEFNFIKLFLFSIIYVSIRQRVNGLFIYNLKDNKEEKSSEAEEAAEPASDSVTVYIQVLCYTLSNDMSQLENEAVRDYIPSSGVILGRTAYTGKKGETVYDALSSVCKSYGVQLDANYRSSYGSVYVEGIGYLYEFDGGPKSGWMYSVNGVFPNYGCSSYELSDGDEIKWLYTCKGIGADL